MLISTSSNTFLKKKNTINLGGELLDFSSPKVMGIVNLTPDSFYDGGKLSDEKKILSQVEKMLEDGATIIDVGAVSTRPGADLLNTKVELSRLLSPLKMIRKEFPDAHLSVDTFRSWVATRVVDEVGAVIINDISGGTLDTKMFETVGKLKVPYVLSHIKGSPKEMHIDPSYDNLIREISSFLSEKLKSVYRMGVNDVILDPGFGFGKNIQHNFELLNKLDAFKVFQIPMMVGLSRKSMVWKTLKTDALHSLNGTTVVNTLALLGGTNILRVHDVKEAVEAIKIVQQLKEK